ncbi:VOC family protein [Planctomycetota bacterium]|nr:VOC family protein [Planctomycetota bacterium]
MSEDRKITRNMYVLAVQDLAKTVAYYRDVLGFGRINLEHEGWGFFSLHECTIMAGECPESPAAGELGNHSYFAYIVFANVDDLNDYHAQVTKNGAELTKQIADEPWAMREFGVRTIDGHRIMFGVDI